MMLHASCDLCAAVDARLLFRATDTNYHFEGVFDIVQCKRCGLVYLDPRPDEDTLRFYYPDADYFCFKTRTELSGLAGNHPFARVVSGLGVDAGSLCDIGCGVGDFLVAARGSGWAVAGVEINESARTLANERLGKEAVFSSFEGAGFPSEAFDVVTLWHALEHLPSPRQVLTEIHRILKRDGIVALAVPNFDSLERRIWGANWIAVSAPTHLFHFTQRTLTCYMAMCGFEVLFVTQQPGANSLAANLLRTLRNLALDPFARKADRLDTAQNKELDAQAPKRSTSFYQVGGQAKARMLRATTELVYPAAWMAAKLRRGPELTLYARKM